MGFAMCFFTQVVSDRWYVTFLGWVRSLLHQINLV